MTPYRGHYIDNVWFCSKAEIDAHIRNELIAEFEQANKMFMSNPDMEHSIYASQIAEQLHADGLDWDEIEELEAATFSSVGN